MNNECTCRREYFLRVGKSINQEFLVPELLTNNVWACAFMLVTMLLYFVGPRLPLAASLHNNLQQQRQVALGASILVYIYIYLKKLCYTWMTSPANKRFLPDVLWSLAGWLAGCLIGWSGRLAETTWTFSGCRGCEQNNGERERRKEVSRERQIKILYKHLYKVNPLSDHRPPRNNKLSAKSTTSVWNVN